MGSPLALARSKVSRSTFFFSPLNHCASSDSEPVSRQLKKIGIAPRCLQMSWQMRIVERR